MWTGMPKKRTSHCTIESITMVDYGVKAKVTESADEADNKRGTSATVQEAVVG